MQKKYFFRPTYPIFFRTVTGNKQFLFLGLIITGLHTDRKCFWLFSPYWILPKYGHFKWALWVSNINTFAWNLVNVQEYFRGNHNTDFSVLHFLEKLWNLEVEHNIFFSFWTKIAEEMVLKYQQEKLDETLLPYWSFLPGMVSVFDGPFLAIYT